MRRREPKGDGLANSSTEEQTSSSPKGQSFPPKPFLEQLLWYVFGLVKGAVGFRDEKDSALAFRSSPSVGE